MKRWQIIALCGAVGFAVLAGAQAEAKDVYVQGYTRKDGTYVAPYVRSSPDNSKANNYGPSRNDYERMQGRVRDNDHDGTPNYLDNDDDNDGVPDDSDSTQY